MLIVPRVSRAFRLPWSMLALVAIALLPLSAQPVSRRLAHYPSMAEHRVELPGSARPHGIHAEPLGNLSGDTALTGMTLVLKPANEQDAELTQLLADQQNPTSPNFHKWLTPEEFGARFGVAGGDLHVLENWLRMQGFAVESVARSSNRIIFSGSASAAEQAFGVTLQRFRRNGREFFENTGNIQLPESLASVVSGISGLSSYRLPAPQIKRATRTGVLARPEYTTSTGTHYLVPWDFRQIYGVNSLLSSGYDGTGITIGVIGQSAVDSAQLTYFQQKTGQSVKLPAMILVPHTSASAKVPDDEAESEFDLEYASGTAPGAFIQFIYTGCANAATGNCNNNGVFDALSYAVTNNLAPILSLSYGGCEAEDASYAQSTLEPLLKQANAQGQTIAVSSGDSGAANCEQSVSATRASAGLAVSYPASSPYVTAVGGTQLNTDSSTYWNNSNSVGGRGSATGYMPEVAWNDTASYGSLTASGGGASKLFSKPSWQVGSAVPSDGQRDIPDISFAANVSEHAYLICDADDPCSSPGSFVVGRDGGAVGGTSASAPNFAATIAIIEQANGSKPLGNINPALYALAEGPNAATIFHDIVSGNNMVPCVTGSVDCVTGSIGYSAGVGYDLVTGLGSVSASALQTALAGYAAATATVALNLSSTTPNVGAAVTFTATVSASNSTPTGTVTFSVDGAITGSPVTLASGTAVYSYGGFTSSGTHTVSAAYAGDSTYRIATASLATIASLDTPTITVTATPITSLAGSAVSFTTMISGTSGTPTGTVSFFVDSNSTAASMVNLNNGSATFSYAGFSAAGIHSVTAVYNGSAIYMPVSRVSTVTVISSPQSITPAVKLVITPGMISAGSTVSISTTVTGSGSTPTGTVSYRIDGNAATTVALSAGTATFSYAGFTAAGVHTVLATYSGDTTYVPGEASTTVTVTTPAITLSVNSPALTVASGGNATMTVTVTSQNGFTGQVGLKLALVSYTGASFTGCYSLSPTTVNTAAGGSASATVTMFPSSNGCTVTGGTTLAMANDGMTAKRRRMRRLPSTGVVICAGLLSCFAFKRRVHISALLVLLVSVAAVGLSGCGSGVSANAAATVTSPANPTSPATKGTYVVQVIAAAVGGTSASSSAQFTLTVQ